MPLCLSACSLTASCERSHLRSVTEVDPVEGFDQCLMVEAQLLQSKGEMNSHCKSPENVIRW